MSETMTVEKVDGPNSNGWYEVTFEGGKVATTKNEELAKAAFQSRGGEVAVVISERVNGRFTNVYLNEIDGVKDTPRKGKATTASAPKSGGGRTPAENDRIARQWAYGRAIELLIGSGGEFAFPLDSVTMSSVSEVATALINATKE